MSYPSFGPRFFDQSLICIWVSLLISSCGGGSDGPDLSTPPARILGRNAKFGVPSWTGPYSVGTREFLWVDSERGESHTSDPDDRRELMVRLFYPAAAAISDQQLPLIHERRWIMSDTDKPKPGYTLRCAN